MIGLRGRRVRRNAEFSLKSGYFEEKRDRTWVPFRKSRWLRSGLFEPYRTGTTPCPIPHEPAHEARLPPSSLAVGLLFCGGSRLPGAVPGSPAQAPSSSRPCPSAPRHDAHRPPQLLVPPSFSGRAELVRIGSDDGWGRTNPDSLDRRIGEREDHIAGANPLHVLVKLVATAIRPGQRRPKIAAFDFLLERLLMVDPLEPTVSDGDGCGTCQNRLSSRL